jgi:hypothetical protein
MFELGSVGLPKPAESMGKPGPTGLVIVLISVLILAPFPALAQGSGSEKSDSEASSGAKVLESPAPPASVQPEETDIPGAGALPAPPDPGETAGTAEKNGAKPACSSLTADERLAFGIIDPLNPIYPITYREDLAAVEPAEPVMAVRLMECEVKGNFAIVSFGNVLKTGKNGDRVLQLEGNLAVMNYFNQSGAAWDFDKSSGSLDESDAWCIPRKEFCTKRIGFNAYGLTGKPEDQFAIEGGKVFSLRRGQMMALQTMVTQLCGKRPEPQQLCIGFGPDQKFCTDLNMERARAMFPQLGAAAAPDCPTAAQ